MKVSQGGQVAVQKGDDSFSFVAQGEAVLEVGKQGRGVQEKIKLKTKKPNKAVVISSVDLDQKEKQIAQDIKNKLRVVDTPQKFAGLNQAQPPALGAEEVAPIRIQGNLKELSNLLPNDDFLPTFDASPLSLNVEVQSLDVKSEVKHFRQPIKAEPQPTKPKIEPKKPRPKNSPFKLQNSNFSVPHVMELVLKADPHHAVALWGGYQRKCVAV